MCVFTYCKRCHLITRNDNLLCDTCARIVAEEQMAEASATHLRQLEAIYGEPPVFCRITDPKGTQTGRQLRAFRDRNRLYCRAANGIMYRVPGGWGSSHMVKAMRKGRLFLFTNGM